ncbi:hypothetical protein Droror1_Dr00025850 [Drosera rotundifolia]
MASVEGIVPITRAFLAQYYEMYPFELAPDVHSVTADVRSVINELMSSSSLTEGQRILVREVDREPPHKIDENMWKNRNTLKKFYSCLRDLIGHFRSNNCALLMILK